MQQQQHQAPTGQVATLAMPRSMLLQWQRRALAILHCTVCGTARAATTDPVAPAVYWSSNPTLPGETLVISGAGLEGARVALCQGPANCTEISGSAVSVWDHSVKLVLPAWCAPGCQVSMAKQGQTVVVPVNRPHYWWAASEWPLSPDDPLGPTITPVVQAGGKLRVFGRALAWSASGGGCISAAGRPTASSTTTLSLVDKEGDAVAVLPTSAASCYEAEFEIPITVSNHAGKLQAVISTVWGSSLPFTVTVPPQVPAPAPLPLRVIDVQKDCSGDVALAMRKASGAPAGAIVRLGAHRYLLTEPLVVPNRTTLQGEGADATTMSFALTPPLSAQSPLRSAVSVGSMVKLLDFSLSLSVDVPAPSIHNKSQFAGTVGVLMPHNASEFTADALRVTTDGNSSNAMRIEGSGFSIKNSLLWQRGCTLASGYQPSTTLLMSNARDGHFCNNTIAWRCSAFDLDTSERVIFEQNLIRLNTTGSVPHGNSVSGYGGPPGRPLNRWWAFLRNRFKRPACDNLAAPTGQCGGRNWMQRETWTTDNSHAQAVGYVASQDTAMLAARSLSTVRMHWVSWSMTPALGTTLVVLNGSGMGQNRLVTGIVDNRTLVIDSPFDDHLGKDSFVAVVNSYHQKLVAGNVFEWTEVVQFFGVNMEGVIADNSITDANVNHSLHTADPVIRKYGGSMRAVGECYHGPAPLFNIEYVGNHFLRSDGIFIQDNYGPAYYQCGGKTGFLGPWVRWMVVRRNSFAGVSLASKAHAGSDPPACAAVAISGVSTDIVAEQDRFECDDGAVRGGYVGDVNKCLHCTFDL
eukprot:SAG31_NODE_4961_length_2834_cov_1.793784_2_plen_805_part_00